MDTVMARAKPRKRALSKKRTSPTAIASTIEMASSAKVPADMAPSCASPPVASTHARSSPPPMSERSTLTATELSGGDTGRAGGGGGAEGAEEERNPPPGERGAERAERAEERVRDLQGEESHAGSLRYQ